jgi:ATP-dependent RNA helicase DDX52/ROK1
VRGMLKDGLMPPVLLFVQSKERAADLFRELIYDGIDVDAIHADRSGAARSSAIARFRAGALAVLIATDLLARGLDFKAVATVINYDFPTSPAAYVHRIGRTGRNGRHGAAVTLFTEEDTELIRPVARLAVASGCTDIPPWMLSLGSGRRDRDAAKRLEMHPPQRQRVGGSSIAKLPTRKRRAVVPGERNERDVRRTKPKRQRKGGHRVEKRNTEDDVESHDSM